MLRRVDWWIDTEVSVERSASIFRLKLSKKIWVESLLGLLIPADEGTMLFWHDSTYLPVYTAERARRQSSIEWVFRGETIYVWLSCDRASLMFSFKYNQQDATLYNILYYCQCSTCFRRFLSPSTGAQKLYTQHRVYVKLACCYR